LRSPVGAVARHVTNTGAPATALRFNLLIKALGLRLSTQGKSKMLIIGAAMRKLLHLAYGVLKSDKPLDDQHSI